MKTVLRVVKNHGRKHLISILSALLLLCAGSQANALMIEIENISDNPQTAVGLGFDDVGYVYINYDDGELAPQGQAGSVFQEDHPEVTEDNLWTFYNLYPSNNTASGFSILLADYIDYPFTLSGGTDSIIITFSESSAVVPEPTSLLLLGSGLVGFWVLRRR